MTSALTLKAEDRRQRFDHIHVGEPFFHKGKFWTRTGTFGAVELHPNEGADSFSIGVTGGGLMVQGVTVKA